MHTHIRYICNWGELQCWHWRDVKSVWSSWRATGNVHTHTSMCRYINYLCLLVQCVTCSVSVPGCQISYTMHLLNNNKLPHKSHDETMLLEFSCFDFWFPSHTFFCLLCIMHKWIKIRCVINLEAENVRNAALWLRDVWIWGWTDVNDRLNME